MYFIYIYSLPIFKLFSMESYFFTDLLAWVKIWFCSLVIAITVNRKWSLGKQTFATNTINGCECVFAIIKNSITTCVYSFFISFIGLPLQPHINICDNTGTLSALHGKQCYWDSKATTIRMYQNIMRSLTSRIL